MEALTGVISTMGDLGEGEFGDQRCNTIAQISAAMLTA